MCLPSTKHQLQLVNLQLPHSQAESGVPSLHGFYNTYAVFTCATQSSIWKTRQGHTGWTISSLCHTQTRTAPRFALTTSRMNGALSGLPNANAKSQRFSYTISQITTLPLVVALNRSSKSQIAARYAAFWQAVPQIALADFLLCP